MHRERLLDLGSIVTIGLTLVLFVIAVAEKGLTHELLQEAAVFLVSVKLILNGVMSASRQKQLRRQLESVERKIDEQNQRKRSKAA
jgi:hypothetical protein